MTFKNLKIPVENNLDEIVMELERLGYKPYQPSPHDECVYAWDDGFFCVDKNMETLGVIYRNTTLAELKEM